MPADHINPGVLTGMPGLNWYTKSRQVPGGDLVVGDCLDSLDHSGARTIRYITGDPADGRLTVWFSSVEGDCEQVHPAVTYDVVDPATHVAPDGTPVTPAR